MRAQERMGDEANQALGRTLHTPDDHFTSLKLDGYSAQPRPGARNHPWWKDRHGRNDDVCELLPLLL